MLDWLHELRLAARSLRSNPGILVIAIVTMALGIGATTFMFSIVYGALYRGLPFPDGDRIMRVSRTNPGQGIERMGVTFTSTRTGGKSSTRSRTSPASTRAR